MHFYDASASVHYEEYRAFGFRRYTIFSHIVSGEIFLFFNYLFYFQYSNLYWLLISGRCPWRRGITSVWRCSWRSNNCEFSPTSELFIWKRWGWQCSMPFLARYGQTSGICQNRLFAKFAQRRNFGLEILGQKSNRHHNKPRSTSFLGDSIYKGKIWFLQFQIGLGSPVFWSCFCP